jgi:hypothetical protein
MQAAEVKIGTLNIKLEYYIPEKNVGKKIKI